MSTLALTAVSILDVWMEGGASSRKFKALACRLTLTGQGNVANPIPAALFGLAYIEDVRSARDSNNNIIPCAPSDDRSVVLLGGSTPGATKTIVATGLASAGNITATGVLATDTLLSATDLTTPSSLSLANFTPGAGVIAQASGAGDIHTLKVQFLLQAAAVAAAGLTGTVHLIVSGLEP